MKKKPENQSSPAMNKTWFTIRNQADVAEISIYGEIGGFGVTDKDFISALKQIPKGQEIDLAINSQGGDVTHALAIYTKLAERREHLTARVDGWAASAASFIAMAGRRLVMPENTMLMIHNPQGFVLGDADDMRKQAEVLDKFRDLIVPIYEAKCGKPRKEIEDSMRDERWFTAEEAEDFGFADEVTEAITITASVDLSKFKHPPIIKTKTPVMNAVLEKLVALKLITAVDAPEKDMLDQIDASVTAHRRVLETLKGDLKTANESNQQLRQQVANRAVSDAIAAGRIKNDEQSIALWTSLFLKDQEEAQKMLGSIAVTPPQGKAARTAPPSNSGEPLNLKAEAEGGATSDDILDQYNAMPEGKAKDQFLNENRHALLRLQRLRQTR
jgi:ATP-dependent Clp endopeptidase proteolytic subunit ClpP